MITQILKTNVYYWHGYSLLYLKGKWVKATPAFDLKLCEKHDIVPVEFDGEHDAVFHPLDRQGRQHIEYLNDRGGFDDLPLKSMYETFRTEYKEEGLEISKNNSGNQKNNKQVM